MASFNIPPDPEEVRKPYTETTWGYSKRNTIDAAKDAPIRFALGCAVGGIVGLAFLLRETSGRRMDAEIRTVWVSGGAVLGILAVVAVVLAASAAVAPSKHRNTARHRVRQLEGWHMDPRLSYDQALDRLRTRIAEGEAICDSVTTSFNPDTAKPMIRIWKVATLVDMNAYDNSWGQTFGNDLHAIDVNPNDQAALLRTFHAWLARLDSLAPERDNHSGTRRLLTQALEQGQTLYERVQTTSTDQDIHDLLPDLNEWIEGRLNLALDVRHPQWFQRVANAGNAMRPAKLPDLKRETLIAWIAAKLEAIQGILDQEPE